MHADTADPGARTPSGSPARARILTAASELFYSQGIRATSAERIIERVGVTKVTFYRHFRTKSELVVAYLKEQASVERTWMESMRHTGDPLGSLRTLATGIGAVSCRPGFRGCAFINAAAEFPDSDDPVRAVVDEHRGWMLREFADIAAEAGASGADSTAKRLMILRDGAMVNGYLGEPASIADSLSAAFTSIITTAMPAAGETTTGREHR
jgi:AcrR family transcriptional regulator